MSCNLLENYIQVFNPANGQTIKEIPITIEDATTCCQRKAFDVLFENAHIEKAGED